VPSFSLIARYWKFASKSKYRTNGDVMAADAGRLLA